MATWLPTWPQLLANIVGVGFFTCNYLAIRLKASFFGHFSLGNPIWVIKKMSEKGLTKMDKQ